VDEEAYRRILKKIAEARASFNAIETELLYQGKTRVSGYADVRAKLVETRVDLTVFEHAFTERWHAFANPGKPGT